MTDIALRLTIPDILSRTVNSHPGSNALSFAGEKPYTWKEVDTSVGAVISFLERNGIVPGDRVSVLSANMPNWGIAYLAITCMGAVAVPVLPDFSTSEISNVLNHSEARMLFVSSSLVSKVEGIDAPGLNLRVLTDDFSAVQGSELPEAFDPARQPARKYTVNEEDLASIIYTSGTTGRSKGVMLSHRNICFTAVKGGNIHPLDENDRFLSVLPLSHTYENTLGLILPLLKGSAVYYLRKPPTPAVLLPALEQIKPTAMLTVPLIIEKIYFNKILPAFQDKLILRLLYKFPPLRKILNRAAGKKLLKTFGGELRFYGIGGAKLNKTVEKFLIEARFPYAIGYGLTETAPLLAGANPKNTAYESTGPALEGVELIIHDPDRKTGEGEIWAKGPNVMMGYYKDPEMTAEVITPDGWFKTGDLGRFDKNNNLYIKGRLKNMIVGASGENIYPEEIESVINNFRHVVESVVIQQKGKLIALVHINMEEFEKKYQHLKSEAHRYEEKIEENLRELRDYVNERVNKFSQISKVKQQHDPFQKTATQKIKRFMYKEKEA